MTQNPHATVSHSTPLSHLANRAMRRYGDFSAARLDPDLAMLMLDFAHDIVDDVKRHPYWDLPLDYYTALEDKRPIPDNIVSHGLLYYYAMQQGSSKMELYRQTYYRHLNGELYYLKYGNGPIDLPATDKQSEPWPESHEHGSNIDSRWPYTLKDK